MKYFVDTLGIPPENLLKMGNRSGIFFDRGQVRKEITDQKTIDYFSKKLEERIPDKDFREFIELFLKWDPNDRILPINALRHQWIKDGMPEHLRNADMFYH